MPSAMEYVDITAIACSLTIHTPESMKQRLQGHWISMAEVLHVIKGAYVCLKSEKKVIVYDARGNGGGVHHQQLQADIRQVYQTTQQ